MPNSRSSSKPSICAGPRAPDAALAVVETDRGKVEMDTIRAQLAAMDQEEAELREKRLAEMADAYKTALASGILSCLLGIVLTVIIGFLIRRADRRPPAPGMASVGPGRTRVGDAGRSAHGAARRQYSSVPGAISRRPCRRGLCRRSATSIGACRPMAFPRMPIFPSASRQKKGCSARQPSKAGRSSSATYPTAISPSARRLARTSRGIWSFRPPAPTARSTRSSNSASSTRSATTVLALLDQASEIHRRGGPFGELSRRTAKPARRNPAPIRGAAGSKRGVARLQRGTRRAEPGAERIAGAAGAAASRTGADQRAARRTGRSNWKRSATISRGPPPRCN